MMFDFQNCDSHVVDSLPENIFGVAHISKDSTILDDCSLSFEELPCFSCKLQHKNSCSLDPSVQNYLSNEDNQRLATFLPTTPSTPRKRKRQDDDDDEDYDFLSDFPFTSPDTKTPILPPKKAINFRIDAEGTDNHETVAESASMDDHWNDPLVEMPLSEITGFDTIIRPVNVQSEDKAIDKAEKSDPEAPTNTERKPLENPGGPKMAVGSKPSISKTASPLSFPDLEISRPKTMLKQVHLQNPMDMSFQRLLFPSLHTWTFNGQTPLANNDSKLPFQVTPRSNQSNPSNRRLPILPPAKSPPESKNQTDALVQTFKEAASNAFTPTPAFGKNTSRPAVTVTPEPGTAACAKDTPKSKKARPVNKQTAKDSPKSKKEKPSNKRTKKHNDSRTEKWNQRYKEAKEFAKKHGHCLIPNVYPANPDLGSWAKRQRYQYSLFTSKDSPRYKENSRSCAIDPERIKKLDSIGFCWHHKNNRWMQRYKELLQFVEKYGHTSVPTWHEENQGLAGWVKVQRRQYRLFQMRQKTAMTEDRIKLLNKVGFTWSCKDPATSKAAVDTQKISSANLDEPESLQKALPTGWG